MTFADRATAYAADVVSGKVPACRQIRQAAQRHLDDLAEGRWTFDADRVEHVCAFAELLPHTKGRWAARRELIKLQDWQVFVIASIFGWIDKSGLRRFREAVIFVPRKNGKSLLAAVIALYMAFADNESGAEVYVGANSEAQAGEVFRPAKAMASRAEGFAEYYGVTVAAKSLFTDDGSFLKTMIGKPGDGSSPHCAVLDEGHENDTSDQYDTMKTGMGAREQPLLLTITTAGVNLAGPCRTLQLHAEQVLSGQLDDDRLFVAIYTIDPEDDWRDFANWRKANPNLGVSVGEDHLRDRLKDALNRPAEQAIVKTKHLNVWVSSATAWINQADWQACADPTITLALLAGRPAWIGCDLSSKSDLAAIVAAVQLDDDRLAYLPYLYVPEGAIERSKSAGAYAQWRETGDLIVTAGSASDFSAIEDQLRELARTLDVRMIAFDPWQSEGLRQRLAADGMPTMDFPQTAATFTPAMIDFEADLLNHKLVHPDNAVMNWCATNLSVRPGRNDTLFPNKPDGQAHLKIDAIVAAIMAKGLAMQAPAAPTLPSIMWL